MLAVAGVLGPGAALVFALALTAMQLLPADPFRWTAAPTPRVVVWDDTAPLLDPAVPRPIDPADGLPINPALPDQGQVLPGPGARSRPDTIRMQQAFVEQP